MQFSELSLGIKKPLLLTQPLGQTLGNFQHLGIFAKSKIHDLDILSATGKIVLAAISQAGETATDSTDKSQIPVKSEGMAENLDRIQETDTVETRSVEKRETAEVKTPIVPEVTQDQSFPQLPLIGQNLNTITSLGQVQGLGQSSVQSLQVLKLTPEPSINQQFAEFSLRGSEDNHNDFSESSFSPLNSSAFDKSHSDLPLENQSSSQTAPTSWSSLAELIGENDDITSSRDRDDEDIEGFMFTPDGFHPMYANPEKKRGKLVDLTEAETPTVSGTNQLPTVTIQPATTAVQSSQSSEPELVSESNLRMLAQEVYKLVRQRLQIERERYRR